MTLNERLAARSGSGIGLVAEDRPGHQVTRTWAEIDRATAALAARLTEARSGPTVVAVNVDNTLGTALALIAALRADLPVLPKPTRSDVLDHLTVLHAQQDGTVTIQPPATAATGPQLPAHAVLLHTGGSTGTPKLLVDTAIRTRPLLPPQARLVSKLNWCAGQTQLVAGPLDHAAPLTFFVEGLFDGNTIVLARRFDPTAALDLIADWQVRWAQLTPFQLDRLSLVVDAKPDALATVRALLHTAAPCPERVKRFWIDRIGPDRLFEMYGASEGIGMTIASGTEWLAHPGTVGRGFWTQIRILDEHKQRLPVGEVGKVYLRSGSTARRNRLQTALDWTPDGFAGVGDYGKLDEDGYLYLQPRQVDLINVGGEKVYPAEVEKVLLEHTEVLDAVVIGRPDHRFGARPHAIVVTRGGAQLDERELKRFCRATLPNVKVPATVRFVAELPRTSAGKLRRSVLDSLLDQETAR